MARGILQGIGDEDEIGYREGDLFLPRGLQSVQNPFSTEVTDAASNPFSVDIQGEQPSTERALGASGTPGDDFLDTNDPKGRGGEQAVLDRLGSKLDGGWDTEKIGNTFLSVAAGLGNTNALTMLRDKQSNTAAGAAAKALLSSSDKHAKGDSDGAMSDIQAFLSGPGAKKLDAKNTQMLVKAYQGLAGEKAEHGEFTKAVDAINSMDPRGPNARLQVAEALRNVKSAKVRKELEGLISLKGQDKNLHFQYDANAGVMSAFNATDGRLVAQNQIAEPREKSETGIAQARAFETMFPGDDYKATQKQAKAGDTAAQRKLARAGLYMREGGKLGDIEKELLKEGLRLPEGLASTREIPDELLKEMTRRKDAREKQKTVSTSVQVQAAKYDDKMERPALQSGAVGKGNRVYRINEDGTYERVGSGEINKMTGHEYVAREVDGKIGQVPGKDAELMDIALRDKANVQKLRPLIKDLLAAYPGYTLVRAAELYVRDKGGDARVRYFNSLQNFTVNALSRVETGSVRPAVTQLENIRKHQMDFNKDTVEGALAKVDLIEANLDNIGRVKLGIPLQMPEPKFTNQSGQKRNTRAFGGGG